MQVRYGLGQAFLRIRLRFRFCLAENTAGMESLAAGLMRTNLKGGINALGQSEEWVLRWEGWEER